MSDGMTVPFPDELLHLEEINMKLKEALEKAEESVRKSEREYMDTETVYGGTPGDIDPHEMFQNEMLHRSRRTEAVPLRWSAATGL